MHQATMPIYVNLMHFQKENHGIKFKVVHSVKQIAMRSSFVVPQVDSSSERNCFSPISIEMD